MNKAFMRHLKAELILHKNSVMLMLGLYALIPLSYLISREFYFLDFEDFDTPKLSLVVYIVTLILAVLFSTSLFGECQREEKADVAFSLPISAKSRFLVKLTMAAGVMVIPYILGMLIILLTALIYSGIHGYTTDIIHGWALFAAAGLAGLVFTIAFSFLCSTFTSSLAGARAVTCIGSIALTILPMLAYAVIILTAHLDIGNDIPLFAQAIGFGGLYAMVEYTHSGFLAEFILANGLNIAISCLMIFIAYKAYCSRERKSIFSFAPAKGYMLVFMLICGGLAMAYTIGETGFLSAIAMALAIAAVYLLILVKKGFGAKCSVKWVSGLIAAEAVFAAVMLVSIMTEGFGMSKLPETESEKYNIQVDTREDDHWEWCDNLKESYSIDEMKKVHEIFARFEKSSGYEPDLGQFVLKGVYSDEHIDNGYMRIYVTTEVMGEKENNTYIGFVDSDCYYYVKGSDLEKLVAELNAL